MPEASVIIPTYDRSGMLRDAVAGVLAQSHGDLEAIVVDDGSTDDTPSVAGSFDDPRVRYFRKENGGVASARNLGLEKAKGRFTAFLDCDDLWPADFLEVMTGRLRENPGYIAAYCARTLLYPDGRRSPSYQKRYCRSGNLTVDLFKKTFMQTSTICFWSKTLESFRFDESLRNAEDSDAWLRLSLKGPFLFVPQVEILFRAEHGVSPRCESSRTNCNRIRVLERFYYRLGGRDVVAASQANRKLSHAYRSVAKSFAAEGGRAAAILMYKKAIEYRPADARLYGGLAAAMLMRKSNDKMPGWRMPEPLGRIKP
jgi:glycosyltransferase involved in cell wall biosynthesis